MDHPTVSTSTNSPFKSIEMVNFSVAASNTVAKVVSQLLECPVCFDPSPSPIYTCSNGHICCGLCHDRLPRGPRPSSKVKCTLCKSSLKINQFAELMSRSNDLMTRCPHQGCQSNIPAAALKKHISTCEFRPILCRNKLRNGGNRCNANIPMMDYPNHLIAQHGDVIKCFDGEQTKFWTVNFYIETILLPDSIESTRENWIDLKTYDHQLISFDNQHFVLCAARANSMFYWWMLLIGNKQNSEKYCYQTQLHTSKGTKFRDCDPMKHQESTIWKLNVFPFNMNEHFDVLKGEYACELGTKVAQYTYCDKNKNKFSIVLTIKKKNEIGDGMIKELIFDKLILEHEIKCLKEDKQKIEESLEKMRKHEQKDAAKRRRMRKLSKKARRENLSPLNSTSTSSTENESTSENE